MLNQLPPPIFKYDVSDMNDLHRRISQWSDYARIPKIELEDVITGRNAIYRLPEAIRKLGVTVGSEIIVVMDDVKFIRNSEEAKPLIQDIIKCCGYRVKPLVLKGDEYGQVHPDFKTIEQVLPALHKDCAVVSVGSGVVTDIAKHACFVWQQENGFEGQLPLISCITANTVPAYASRFAIITKDGVKRTWPSRTPQILIMDYQLLCDCPLGLTVGGVGDTFPVFCSFADWYIADALGMADFLDASWRIMDDAKDLLIPYSAEIAQRSERGMEVLGKCLTLCGLTMTYARDSVPVSGFEHVMSHMLDMSAAADGRKIGVHGQQVGVAAIWSLIQFEMMIDYLDKNAGDIRIDRCQPAKEDIEKQVMDVFAPIDATGAMGRECWNDVNQKLENWYKARSKAESFLENWATHRKALKQLLPFSAEQCAEALALSTHPISPWEMDVPVSEERMRWALRNARLMRKRFTSGDLVAFLGMYSEEWERKIVDRAAHIAKKNALS
ncbi:MAG: iron-containing alcohol dehydrogenase [Christensenellales bacterium]|jgi:glycerol-1-phosphate dehydrogenase [NAD(P)+]